MRWSVKFNLLALCVLTLLPIGYFAQLMGLQNVEAGRKLATEGTRIPARLTTEIDPRRIRGRSQIQIYVFSIDGVEYKGDRKRTKTEFLRDPYVYYLPENPKVNADGPDYFFHRGESALKLAQTLYLIAAVASATILLWPRPTSP